MAPNLVLALALAFLLAPATLAVRKGEWTMQSKNGQIWQLSKNTYAFDPTRNMWHCKKRVKILPHNPAIKDYTAIFNRELNLLRRQGGGTLRLTAGTYFHANQIIMPSYTCIIGAGMDRTFIKLIDRAPRFRKSGSIRSMWTERITIADLTQDGNRASQGTDSSHNYGRYGFFSELTNFVYLKNFRVQNNVFYGFDPHGSKKHWSYKLVMEGCQAINNGLDGFTIDQTVHASILNGYARANDRHGYNIVTGTQQALFRGCVAVGNGQNSNVGFGFVVQNNHDLGTNSVAFEKITARNNWRGAVKLRGVFNVWASDSTFTGNGKSVCYELSNTRNVYLRNNACSGFRSTRKFKVSNAQFVETGARDQLAVAPPRPRPRVVVPPRRPADNRPDPNCLRGRRAANACCAGGCLQCGGTGCGAKGNFPGGVNAVGSCCVTPIRTAARPCARFPPPCLL